MLLLWHVVAPNRTVGWRTMSDSGARGPGSEAWQIALDVGMPESAAAALHVKHEPTRYTHTHIQTYIYIYTRYIHICIYIYIYMCVHMYICRCVFKCAQVDFHVCRHYLHVHLHTYAYM